MHSDIPKESRLASRLIMINPDKHVLYLRATEPKMGHVFWVMPGGGLEPNESFEDAANREGYEETGGTFDLGPYVWFRRHKHVWNGSPFDQYERFFVALMSETSYNPPNQDGYISKHKWWSLSELQASNDEFAPRNIRNIIVPILDGKYPEKPIDCGV
jgi:8-oxo-dGTP pyrophosphatase MutT (NUDIX family)